MSRIIRQLGRFPITITYVNFDKHKHKYNIYKCKSMPIRIQNDNKPCFCRYIRCKNPEVCKKIGICYVDWEPELIKE